MLHFSGKLQFRLHLFLQTMNKQFVLLVLGMSREIPKMPTIFSSSPRKGIFVVETPRMPVRPCFLLLPITG
jgi:hypothetical protein